MVKAKITGMEMISEPVDKALGKLYLGMGTPSIMFAMGHIHRHFTGKAIDMFNSETDPQGEAWKPLAEATKQIRVSLGYPPGPINERSGRLRDYLVTAKSDILGSSDSVISYAYPSRGFPPADLMGAFEQASGLNPKAPTARRVVGMNEQDVAFVLATLGASIFGLREGM